jgi:hypothetical protein
MSISGGPISSAPISSEFGTRVPQNWVVAFDDTVFVTDLVSVIGGNVAVFNDGADVAEGFSRTVSYARTKADTAAAVDALTKAVNRPRALADSAAASDAFARQVDLQRALGDLAGATDALTSVHNYGRQFDDAVAARDARSFDFHFTLNDVVVAVDQVATLQIRTLLDSVGVVDAITLTLARTSLKLEAEPTISYVADVSVSADYRLTADPSSQLSIESVEEYSPEARSPAHAE